LLFQSAYVIVSPMSVYIRAQIARRRQELVDIERRALELKAELRAYEDALVD